jgi:catechol 2,3-dioxygenase-like lactoylglutathione lyase family enzyme
MAEVELLDAIAILSVSDVPRSLAFYRDSLGFDTDFALDGFPYAGVRRGRMALHLDGSAHEFAHRPGHCRFHIRGVNELYGELEPRGVVKADEQLADMPHGLRQFSILDPDGNRITFAEPLA